ncbi:MAG: endolytic transglycosylase MltG [Jhaorihella sp.]
MWKALASNMLTILAVVLFLLAGVILWGKSQYSAQGPLDEPICFRVERGTNMTRVSRELERAGAISSGVIFRMGADYSDKTADLKAGSFLVPEGASMAAIVDAITRGGASTCGTEVVYRIGIGNTVALVRELDPATQKYVERADFDPAGEAPALYTEKVGEPDTRFRIAMAEGVTSWQVVEALKAIDVLSGEVAEHPPEGSLAPDSYEIRPGTERTAVLDEMQGRQTLLLNAAWESREADLPLASPQELLILASIVEKETGLPDERGQVAAVFVNRLRQGMRLQTDPTVIYGLTKGKGGLGRGLRQSELRKITPWNTYVIDGLPPTPIANPGAASLEAAAHPGSSDFLFFVADGTGGHAFAETLEEHNRNVAKWREIEAQQAAPQD